MLKRSLFLSVIGMVAILGVSVYGVAAAEWCVLLELFTHIGCPGCPNAEQALDSLTCEYGSDSLVIIRYHVIPGNDPFYRQESFNRALNYYGIGGTPWVFFDGGMKVIEAHSVAEAYADYKANIDARMTVASPLSMTLSATYDSLSRSVSGIVQVTAEDTVPDYPLTMRVALIESFLVEEDEVYREIMRDMIPDEEGLSFSIEPEGTYCDTVNFVLDTLYQEENCDLVVFIQDDSTLSDSTCSVLQSIQQPLPVPRTPMAMTDLSITKSESSLSFSWSAVTEDTRGFFQPVDRYRIYRDTSHFYQPEELVLLDSTVGLDFLDDDAGHVGDPDLNGFYVVTAVAGDKESEPSTVVGEIDKFLSNGK